jgi:hypothetical protein
MDTKYIHHLYPHSPFPVPTYITLVLATRKDLFFLPAFHCLLYNFLLGYIHYTGGFMVTALIRLIVYIG